VSIQFSVFLKMAGVDINPLLLVFGLPPDVVAATLGDVGIKEVVGLATGVSRSILISSFHPITLYFFFSSLITWPSVLTGVSRSATSREVNRPRPSSNPGLTETLSPATDPPGDDRHFSPFPEGTLCFE